MPTLTRWFIKSALIYLAAALLLAVLLAISPLVTMPGFVIFLNPAYFHLFMVGWVTQMIFGVIYWMFPIITRANPRGNIKLAWASYSLLNIGLLLRVIGEPLVGRNPNTLWGWLLVVAAVLQWTAAVCFIIIGWPRIKDRYRGD